MNLSRINTILIICIILVNGFVIATPFLPALLFRVQDTNGSKQQQLTQRVHGIPAPVSTPKADQLIIPTMLLDTPLYEGGDMYAQLDKGVWRWPASSTPDKGGNTVLLGHRFTYSNPRGAFYFLDKLEEHDEIGITWQGKSYRYTVSDVRVVPSTETSILKNTEDDRLTLFTCTPLWSPKERLVITARREANL